MATNNNDISIDQIAGCLLKNNFYLTALELHTELSENGRELPRLRDFFSNPSNFEQIQTNVNPLHKTPSIQTFDSLDLTRYSDDIDKDRNEDKVVLEFELRKAKETINKLRNTLTMATSEQDCANLTSSVRTIRNMDNDELRDNLSSYSDSILPHEKNAINFLINEYLLSQDYKMTSVTFAEENESQDLEDWDVVGLNRSKPPSIITLYRYYYNKHEMNKDEIKKEEIEKNDFSTQISFDNDLISNQSAKINHLNEKQSLLVTKIEKLQSEIDNLGFERECLLRKIDSLVNSNGKIMNTNENILDETLTQIGVDEVKREKLSERKIPLMFKEFTDKIFTHKFNDDNDALLKDLELIRSNYDSLLGCLAKYLPIILPNILLQKRNEILPLIVSTAILQENSNERDSLLKLMFDLVKKPDSEQRSIILAGCVAFARHAGAQRTLNELLPQFWEQINNKHDEKRCLVAESCTILAPFVTHDIRSSLMLSMLKQIITQDKCEEVRISATKSLGILVNYIRNEDKFSECIDLMNNCLNDTLGVQTCAYSLLIPSICLWSIEINRIKDLIVSETMIKLQNALHVLNREEAKKQLNVLKHMITFIYAYVLVKTDIIGELKTPRGDYFFCNSQVLIQKIKTKSNSLDLYKLEVIIEDKLDELIASFDTFVVNNDFNEEFLWIEDDFLKVLIEITAQIESTNSIVQDLIDLFSHFCLTFGHHYSNLKIIPLFNSLIDKQKEANELSFFSRATIPIYFSGVLSVCYNECNESHDDNDLFDDQFKKINTYLRDLLVFFAEKSLIIEPLVIIFKQLEELKHGQNCYLQLLLSTLWDGIVHQSINVRCYTAQLSEVIIKSLSETTLSNRVLPALITLANDQEFVVRCTSISPLVSVIEYFQNKEILERVYTQLQLFMNDQTLKNDACVKENLLKGFKRIVLKADTKFREEDILQYLEFLVNQIIQSFHSPMMTKEKYDHNQLLIIFDIYNSLACCNLSQKSIIESLLPNLNSLKQIFMQDNYSNNDIIKSTSNLIREFEEKGCHNFRQNENFSSLPNSNSNENNFKSIMFKGLSSSKEKFSFLLNKRH